MWIIQNETLLSIPDDAPLTFQEPEHEGSGHWLLYDNTVPA